MKKKQEINFNDAFLELAGSLTADQKPPIELSSFENFVLDIFAKSYPNYSFNTWHVRKLCAILDDVFNNQINKMLLVVLPRYHLKSTICGYATTIYRMLSGFGDGMYISYKAELAEFHMRNIKRCIEDNYILNRAMTDLNPKSDISVSYRIGNRKMQIMSSGIFSVKRGIHTDLICVSDDVLGDLQNPMNFTELDKAKRIFDAEVMNIPNKNCPLIVIGTPIDFNDLLFSLKENPMFKSIWMPAIDPDLEHEVLWESMYGKEWLERRKESGGWKAFSSEFLLMPVLATDAFITRDQIDTVVSKLENYRVPGY